MKFDEKKDAAIEILKGLGIRTSTHSPPIFRMLWHLGFRVPPPHFNSFGSNALITGITFAAFFGPFMAFKHLVEDEHALPLLSTINITAIYLTPLISVIFGVCSAWYYLLSAKKYRLDQWQDL